MKSITPFTFAERLGRVMGRLWQGCVRLDRAARARLVAQGYAPGMVAAVMLVAEVVALGLAAYVAFWLIAPLVLLALAAWVLHRGKSEIPVMEDGAEWREGHGGFGLYEVAPETWSS